MVQGSPYFIQGPLGLVIILGGTFSLLSSLLDSGEQPVSQGWMGVETAGVNFLKPAGDWFLGDPSNQSPAC